MKYNLPAKILVKIQRFKIIAHSSITPFEVIQTMKEGHLLKGNIKNVSKKYLIS